MSKRISILFFIVTAALCGLVFRIISVNASDYAKTASLSNSKTITIAKSRGTIYDCNLEPLVNTQDEYAIAVKPTAVGLNSVSKYVGESRLNMIRDELAMGNPSLVRVSQRADKGKDIKVISYKRRYSDDQLAVHLIGYLDSEGNGVTGIEQGYNDYLSENSGTLKAAFYVDAKGRNLSGAEIDVIDDGYSSYRGVVLTIDTSVQEALEKALDDSGIFSGCAVAVDPNTGEIKAMVSRPVYNQFNIAENLYDSNSPLVNKALEAYSVGSTFKVVVAAAAIEEIPLCYEDKFNCTGSVTVGNTCFSCFNHTAHNTETMEDALIHSCNTYFIDMAQKVGAGRILGTAEKMGFGSKFTLCNNVTSKSGNIPELKQITSLADVANLGFGQGSLLATPLQIATAFSSIANGGYYIEPSLLKGYLDDDGNFKENRSRTVKTRILRSSTCTSLGKMLESVVEQNGSAMPENVTAAGKTATAQTGQYKNDVEICHSWFAGWFPAEKPRLVIVIMKENGTSGNADCAPAFKKAVDSLTSGNS